MRGQGEQRPVQQYPAAILGITYSLLKTVKNQDKWCVFIGTQECVFAIAYIASEWNCNQWKKQYKYNDKWSSQLSDQEKTKSRALRLFTFFVGMLKKDVSQTNTPNYEYIKS